MKKLTTLIPSPRTFTTLDGTYTLPNPLPISGGGAQAAYLAERLGITAGVRVGSGDGGVRFVENAQLAREAYRIKVADGGVDIEASTPQGRAWAVQTLLQLLPVSVWGDGPVEPKSLVLPHCDIEDEPKFAWRGSHVDVSRHFLSFEGLLSHLEVMAGHKLNVLHLHLTDDQGWRIPITGYPELTNKGAWRPGTIEGHQPAAHPDFGDDWPTHDGRPHGGFYTREQIQHLVARASDLGIMVVPEIDMPGHMEAAVCAYPELGCVEVEHPRTSWGISQHVLSLTDSSVKFCLDVLEDVATLFPGSPIHIGGDECPGQEWLTHGPSQETMKRVGATTVHEAQAWFEKEITTALVERGITPVAWDEVLEGEVPAGLNVMVWRDAKAVGAAARAGHNVIAAPMEFTYFDWAQHKQPNAPLVIGGYLPLAKVAQFIDLLDAVDDSSQGRLLGGQFQIWTEYVRSWSRVEYQIWPRGASIAQQLWSGHAGELATLAGFGDHLDRLTYAGLNWCRDTDEE